MADAVKSVPLNVRGGSSSGSWDMARALPVGAALYDNVMYILFPCIYHCKEPATRCFRSTDTRQCTTLPSPRPYFERSYYSTSRSTLSGQRSRRQGDECGIQLKDRYAGAHKDNSLFRRSSARLGGLWHRHVKAVALASVERHRFLSLLLHAKAPVSRR